MKRYFTFLLVFVLCLSSAVPILANDDGISLTYNGKPISFDEAPFISDGRIMVPVRAIFEAIGAEVVWDGDTQTAHSVMGDVRVSMTLGKKEFTVNGEKKEMDVSVVMKSDRIFAPARYVAESFGKKISYHQDSRTAVISDDNEYTFYENISLPVPAFDWVEGAVFQKQHTNENGNTVYSYTCKENGISDYLNFLQLDFGYSAYNMNFDSGKVIYSYIFEKLKIDVSEMVGADGLYSVDIVPDADSVYLIKNEVQNHPSDSIGPEPQIPDIDYSQVDYGKITGSTLVEIYTDDGDEFYVYAYSPVDMAYYENCIESQGWHLYDYEFDIDSFGYTKYWIKDDILLCVSVNHLYNYVMVSVM